MPGFRDRLKTVDESGRRLWVQAEIFSGPWRKRRGWVALFLIGVYLGLPWVKVNNLPFFQIDFLSRKVILAGNTFSLHEMGILIPLILIFLFSVFALTALFGRVWCGWGCPQTVFMEFVYRPIEQWLEGKSGARKTLSWSSPQKFFKWTLFVLVTFIISNSFLAYFIGIDRLLEVISASPSENPILFSIMVFVSLAFLFNFGWFREQMCTVTCPYGRLQSVLSDKQTLLVSYDSARGEPRGYKEKGSCIDCGRCVQVCPTGIDIRDGLQLECINCLACVDVCNDIMAKVKRPPDLVFFRRGSPMTRAGWVRSAGYALIILLLAGFSVYQMNAREFIEVEILRGGAVHFEEINGLISNSITGRITNKGDVTARLELSMPEVELEKGQFVFPEKILEIPAGASRQVILFVNLPQSSFFQGKSQKRLVLLDQKGGTQDVHFTVFGPNR